MDAVLFLKERDRMCGNFSMCKAGCPLGHNVLTCSERIREEPEKSVEIVEKWSRENPVKTRMSDFFEKHPNALKKSSGRPLVCAYHVGYCTNDECKTEETNCLDCWSRPLEVTK